MKDKKKKHWRNKVADFLLDVAIFFSMIAILGVSVMGYYDDFDGNPRGSGTTNDIVGNGWTEESGTNAYVSDDYLIASTGARSVTSTELTNVTWTCIQFNDTNDYSATVWYYQYNPEKVMYFYWATETQFQYYDGGGYQDCINPIYPTDDAWLCMNSETNEVWYGNNSADSRLECTISTTYDEGANDWKIAWNTGGSGQLNVWGAVNQNETFAYAMGEVPVGAEPDFNTSILVGNASIQSFQFSSGDWADAFTENITLEQSTNLSALITLNLEKLTGATATAYGRFLLNDTIAENMTLRTMTSGDIGSTGMMEQYYDLSAGSYNITFQVRRDGTGIIEASNIDFILVEAETVHGYYLDTNHSHDEFSFTHTNERDAFNFSTYSYNVTPMFLTSINIVNITSEETPYLRFKNLFDNEASDYIGRKVSSSGSYGSFMITGLLNASGNWNNYTYGAFSSSGNTATVNKSHMIFGLTDYTGNLITSNSIDNNASFDDSLSLTSGTSKVASETIQINNGTGIFISYSQSLLNNGTGTTVTHIVNVTDYLGNVVCSFTKDRVYSASAYGNVFIYGHCDDFGQYTVNNVTVESYIITTSSDMWLYEDNIVTLESWPFDVSPVPDTTPPTVELYYPTYDTWSNGTINGSCIDDSVIVNVTVNSTDWTFSGTPSNWTFTYTGTDSIENVSLDISCIDIAGNNGSLNYTEGVDIVKPHCYTLENTTVTSNNSYDWNVSCVDDLNLYSLNVSCTGGTLYNFSLENINITHYNFTNSTGNLTTDMICTWTTKDAHTLLDIRERINDDDIRTVDSAIRINNLDIIEYNDVSGDFVSVETTLLKDRISYDYEFSAVGAKIFYVRGEKKVDYIGSELYRGHFVVDNNYWVDFEEFDSGIGDFSVRRLSDNVYEVRIETLTEVIRFNSVGLLNVNEQTQTFTVVAADTTTTTTDTNFNSTGWLFFVLVVLYIAIILVCFFSKTFNMFHFVALFYGIMLAKYVSDNFDITLLAPLVFAIGVAAGIHGLFLKN